MLLAHATSQHADITAQHCTSAETAGLHGAALSSKLAHILINEVLERPNRCESVRKICCVSTMHTAEHIARKSWLVSLELLVPLCRALEWLEGLRIQLNDDSKMSSNVSGSHHLSLMVLWTLTALLCHPIAEVQVSAFHQGSRIEAGMAVP